MPIDQELVFKYFQFYTVFLLVSTGSQIRAIPNMCYTISH